MKVMLNWFEVVKSDDLQQLLYSYIKLIYTYTMLLYSYITHVRAGLWELLTKQFDVSGSEGHGGTFGRRSRCFKVKNGG